MDMKPRAARIQLDSPTVYNKKSVHLLNSVLFPVRYGPAFYARVVRQPALSRLAYYDDVLVGAMCCRYERVEEGSSRLKLYIMTIGVLPPYRRKGIASLMLDYILDFAQKDERVEEVYLHLWTTNDEAADFYKKHGFVIGEKLPGYYKNIDPPDGFVVTKKMVREENKKTKTEKK